MWFLWYIWDGGGGHWLVRMEWRPAGGSLCLPLLIFPCTIKSRSSLLAPAHPGGPGKRAIKRLWCGGGCYQLTHILTGITDVGWVCCNLVQGLFWFHICVSDCFVSYASNNSLFAVPANQEFVYIRPQSQDETGDLVKYYLDQLHSSCLRTQTGQFLFRECHLSHV